MSLSLSMETRQHCCNRGGTTKCRSAIFDNGEAGNICTYALFEPTASSFAGLPQTMPTIKESQRVT